MRPDNQAYLRTLLDIEHVAMSPGWSAADPACLADAAIRELTRFLEPELAHEIQAVLADYARAKA